MTLQTYILEASYKGNIGFEEMMKFYQIANPTQIRRLEDLIDEDKEREAWQYVQKVTGMELQDK